jgi:hypothetical protein
MPHIYDCYKMMRQVTEPSFPILLSDLKAACDVTTDINKKYPTIASVNDIFMGVDFVPETLSDVFVKKINRSIELHETVRNKPKKSHSIDSPTDQLLLNYFKMSLNEKMSSREMNNSCINDWAKKKITPVTLPILLVDTTAAEGVMAQLTLWNTERESSPTSSAFIPAPSSYMLLCEATFLAGFNHVQTYIQGLLNEKPMPVIVWDLKPLSGEDLLILEGQSASAAIAVGTLCAIREYFQFDERLHTNLGQIDTKNAAISASFTGSGHLDRVEGLKEKIQATKDYNNKNRGSFNQVYVSQDQKELEDLFELRGFKMTPCSHITNLVETLAKNTNATALFGEYPHVIDALHNKANQSIDFYADFTGRNWLKDKVVAEVKQVLASKNKGGIVSLVAPAGWGKTAFALHLLEESASENALPIQGYAFVRREAGKAYERFKELASDASTVIRQLNNCTRHFLNMPRELGGTLDTKSIFETLLKDCGDRATPAHPIHLLLDAADELTIPLSELLPDTRWPANVVLLVTARAPGLNNIGDRANRPFRTLTIGDESSVESAMSDIEAYIERRNKDIQSTHGISIESIKQVILNACRDSQSGQYYFLVAHGLLVDRPNLVADIDEWVKYPDKLPTGLQDYINKQIERALERASQLCISQARIRQPEYKLTREDLELITESSQVASIFVLHFIAISETSWCTQDVTALINKLFSLATQNSSIAADLAVFGVDPVDKIKLPLIFRGLQDLFGTASNEYQANFIHTLYRETIVNQLSTTEKREALHRLLGMLCEACWIKPEQSFSELIVNYALREGVIHLAKGQQVLIAAKRLLDFNANETGYLDKLYQTLPRDALPIVMRGIQQIQRTSTSSDKEWLTALDSLRFVLSEHDPYLQSKEVDLLPTLYNAMVGYFTETTEFGQRLFNEIEQFKKPWMKSLNPDPADAFGPIILNLSAWGEFKQTAEK